MATTLAQIRQNRLNVDLGLDLTSGTSGDGDVSMGSTDVRSQAIKVALAKLWPRMGRFAQEDVTPSTTALEYALTTLDDVEAIDLIGGTNTQPIDKGNNFRFLFLETTAATPIRRLRLPASFGTGTFTTIRCYGYIRYISELADDAATLDVPIADEWVVTTGARAEIYRRKLNERINYERYNVQSRDNDVTVQDLVTLYAMASREFEDAINSRVRGFMTGHSFRP